MPPPPGRRHRRHGTGRQHRHNNHAGIRRVGGIHLTGATQVSGTPESAGHTGSLAPRPARTSAAGVGALRLNGEPEDALCGRPHNASIVITAPARSANAFSRSRTAGISFDLTSTATWPRTAPMPCASAATRCGAFPVSSFAPRTVLPSMAITSRPLTRGPGVQPGSKDLIEHVGADQGESAPERGLRRRAAGRAQPCQHVRPGIGGPLPDRGERPRPRDHRRDPDREQAGQWMPPPASLPRVRDLGKEFEKVLAAGSRNGRRCHRRAGVPRGRRR